MSTKPTAPAVNKPTLAQFKKWAKDNKPLAEAVVKAKAMAQAERERVNAYIQPLFESFEFVDEEGKKIGNQRDLDLCLDDTKCKAFYDQSAAAHRAHGFTGPEGHCPALCAETLQIKAENCLIKSGCEFLGVKGFGAFAGDKRAKMLDLLLNTCFNKDNKG